MNVVLQKFGKGFALGTVAAEVALLSALQNAGCTFHDIADLKAVGVAVLTGFFAGILHALVAYFLPNVPPAV